MTIEATDVPESNRYEARVGGESSIAGFARYARTSTLITFMHTEVDPEYEGRGLGSAHVRTPLDDARAAGLRVKALCPFYRSWIKRHPEYVDLLGETPDSATD